MEKHFTVSAFIIFENRVLLHLHKKTNKILQVGGHIEKDESPSEAILREIREETGLSVELYCSKNLVKDSGSQELNSGEHLNMHSVGEHLHMDFVFFAKSHSNRIVHNEKDKADNWKWYNEEELKSTNNIPNNVVRYALEALEVLKN